MNKNKATAIIQARMTSSRLPGKILKPLAGKPVLWHVVNRLKHTKRLDEVVIATTDKESDIVTKQFCSENGIQCFRGSEEDVLDRYYQAAKKFGADPIVRITADCPLIDPIIVDEVIEGFFSGGYEVYGLSGEFPDGLDCGLFSFWVLEDTWKHAALPSEREHVGPYMNKHPEKYRIGRYEKFKGLGHHRWTLDEETDYHFLIEIFKRLYKPNTLFLTQDILHLLEQEPELMKINSGIVRNEGYLKSLQEDNKYINEKKCLSTGRGQQLYKRAKRLIPGGTQLLSKRPEMFAPNVWPAYYKKAKGCRVWDLDNNEYIDMSIMGIGANILGYADDDVDRSVIEAIKNGSSSSLNCPEEFELAELLTEIHPWAQMVRYARSGGEAMAIAVRIARAFTGRDIVLFSGYHGWQDWYLAANLGENDALDGQLMPGLAPKGVPHGLSGTALPFYFHDMQNLSETIKKKKKQIAAIVVEPARGEEISFDALRQLKDFTGEIGAVLIFDEITTGFRMCAGGIHLKYGINPDITVFAKSMANGYAMAAVIGTEKVMQAAQTTFISSTNWTERIGPTAAIATIQKYIKENIADHIIGIGNAVQKVWQEKADKHHLNIHVSGIPTLGHFAFKGDRNREMMTFFTIEMLKHGFLGFHQFKPSSAHTTQDVKAYAEAVDNIFEKISRSDPTNLLQTPPAHEGFHRLTKE